MARYSYNKQQQNRRRNNVSFCRLALALVLLFYLCSHGDMARDVCKGFIHAVKKSLFVFVFMNFIIFALYLLSSPKRIRPPGDIVCMHDNLGSDDDDIVDSLTVEEMEAEDDDSEEMVEDKHIIWMESSREIVTVSDYSEASSYGELELRRMERGLSRDLLITMRESEWRLLDDMNNEEFRFIIETFIAARNNIMIQENTHDDSW